MIVLLFSLANGKLVTSIRKELTFIYYQHIFFKKKKASVFFVPSFLFLSQQHQKKIRKNQWPNCKVAGKRKRLQGINSHHLFTV